jgi:hypothetical protein
MADRNSRRSRCRAVRECPAKARRHVFASQRGISRSNHIRPRFCRSGLLGGNWKIRPAAGLYFKREWCAVVDEVSADLDMVRYWDLAATEKMALNDPDWTAGIKLGRDRNGGYWLLDVVR